jgi:hypothetical protein
MEYVVTSLCLIVHVGYGSPLFAQASPMNVQVIERAFANATDLKLINKLSDLPPDVVHAFRSVVSWESIVDWGETWNETDVIGREPTSQHVFSAVSKHVAVVVFQSGGIDGRSTTVVVAQRGKPGYCVYRLGDALPREMSAIQWSVRNPNAHWDGVKMRCEYGGLP